MSTANPTTEVDALFDQSLKLTPKQRLELGERLIDSVPMFPDKESEDKLAETVERRIRELENGSVQAVPFDDAIKVVEKDLDDIRRDAR